MRENADFLKRLYQPGTRIRCGAMADPWSPVRPGATGTVTGVDNCGIIHITMDDGRHQKFTPEEDKFTVEKYAIKS